MNGRDRDRDRDNSKPASGSGNVHQCALLFIISCPLDTQFNHLMDSKLAIHPCYTPARQSLNVNRRRNKHLSVALSPHELFNLVCDGHSNCDFYRNQNIIIIRLTLTLERPSNVVLNLSPRQIRDKVKPYGRLSVGQQT